MRGIARACADDSTGDPGGFREGVCVCGGGGVPEETGGGGVEDGGWVGEVDVQGRVRPCVMKDTELEKI